MSRPWFPEQEVSAEQARIIVESEFGTLAPVQLEPIGAGWDNTAFLVNRTYVFRFPRRQVAVDLLVLESRLLPILAPHLPVSVPVPLFLGQPDGSYPWPFAGYRFLPGRTACTAGLDENQRTNAAEPIAHFLSALHSFPQDEAERVGAGRDAFDRLVLEKRVPKARELLGQLHAVGLLADIGPLLELLDTVADTPVPEHLTLVHGDFDVRHVLVDDAGRLTGVIDWGDVHLGHRAVDLAIAHSFLPPSAHDRFRRAYGEIDDNSWRLARFRALYVAAFVVLFGHETHQPDLVREGLWTLRNVVAD
jgi:aminoglycoside phosphotransferase (APT) family kinase protein